MTLEEMILDLTSRTPSGGSCRLGDVSFKVWYCTDIWEWEFQGETYFDAQDLAEAILRARYVSPVRVPALAWGGERRLGGDRAKQGSHRRQASHSGEGPGPPVPGA